MNEPASKISPASSSTFCAANCFANQTIPFAGVAYGVWRNPTALVLPNYRQEAMILYQTLKPTLKPAFKPLLLTSLKENAGDLRKLWRMI
jgi:hypothetical protein